MTLKTMSKSIPVDTRQEDWKELKLIFFFLLSMLLSANMPVYWALLQCFLVKKSWEKGINY